MPIAVVNWNIYCEIQGLLDQLDQQFSQCFRQIERYRIRLAHETQREDISTCGRRYHLSWGKSPWTDAVFWWKCGSIEYPEFGTWLFFEKEEKI